MPDDLLAGDDMVDELLGGEFMPEQPRDVGGLMVRRRTLTFGGGGVGDEAFRSLSSAAVAAAAVVVVVSA